MSGRNLQTLKNCLSALAVRALRQLRPLTGIWGSAKSFWKNLGFELMKYLAAALPDSWDRVYNLCREKEKEKHVNLVYHKNMLSSTPIQHWITMKEIWSREDKGNCLHNITYKFSWRSRGEVWVILEHVMWCCRVLGIGLQFVLLQAGSANTETKCQKC